MRKLMKKWSFLFSSQIFVRQKFLVSWSVWVKWSLKMSLLVICEILRLFFNTLTADNKSSLCNCEILLQQVQMQLSKKHENFFRFFCSISEIYIKLSIFWKKKKDDPHSWCISKITNCERRLKSPVSEYTSTITMLKVPKHCWYLHESTFMTFSHHCEGNRV